MMSPGPTSNDRAAWLAEHTIGLRSIDPADVDYSDLEALVPLVGDAQVVQFGEQSHGDGATFLAKSRLIKFLHQRLGFDVLAFESGLYACDVAWRRLLAGEASRRAFDAGIFDIFAKSEQVQNLIDYVGEASRSDHPMRLAGVDSQISSRAAAQAFPADLDDACRRLGVTLDASDMASISAATSFLGTITATLTDAEAGPLIDALDRAADAFGVSHHDREAVFWSRVLRSFARQIPATITNRARKAEAERRHRAGQSPTPWIMAHNNARDREMGQHLVWLANERFANHRIAVWAHTAHIMRNAWLVDGQPHAFFDGFVSMGHHAYEALGDRLLSIGFTAYSGECGNVREAQRQDVPPASDGSIEDLLVRADVENGVLDIRPQPGAEWLTHPFLARPLNNWEFAAPWSQMLDVLVFTRTMTPSTRRLE